MRRLLLILAAACLVSCISFPRASQQARAQKVGNKTAAAPATVTEAAPPVKNREKFSDPYFRQD